MKRVFPELLKQFHKIEIDYADGEGIDFEPFDNFFSEDETSDWIKAWTGNNDVNGHDYLIFGQDGTGGYAAFWCVRETSDLLKQPIVFFGSEGELGVVAQSFYDYVWLFANGVGPYEAVAYLDDEVSLHQEFFEFARRHAPKQEKTPMEVLEKAKAEFPGFVASIEALCC